MNAQTREALQITKCTPCEGGVAAFTADEVRDQLTQLDGWQVAEDGLSIYKSWNCKNFVKSLAFANRIGDVAEAEQHHPDLHLTGYRHLKVVLTTHAIGGLSINDFILAAKIDQVN
jgi:4a-hydroxytetrahydrobiopterin dehydratase